MPLHGRETHEFTTKVHDTTKKKLNKIKKRTALIYQFLRVISMQPGMVAHACNSAPSEVDTGGSPDVESLRPA